MDTIHIIMPVYNVLPYLEDAIKSVINQTDKNFKLILVDDGSKDNSINIINEIWHWCIFIDERFSWQNIRSIY